MIVADPDVDPDGLLACRSLAHAYPFAKIRYYARIDSTNSAALNDLDQLTDPDKPRLYLADAQTAGRGRHGRTWVADQGTLTFSLVVGYRDYLGRTPAPIAIAVGVAVARTIEHLAAPFAARLKWPNDVYLNGGKVAGVLIEAAPAKSDVIVVGIGLNVATDFRNQPSLADAPTTSICSLTQRYPHRYQWLSECVAQVFAAIDQVKQQPQEIIQEQRRRCLLKGKPLRYLVGDQWHHGICQGIDHRGALEVLAGNTLHRLTSGEVQQCRLSL